MMANVRSQPSRMHEVGLAQLIAFAGCADAGGPASPSNRTGEYVIPKSKQPVRGKTGGPMENTDVLGFLRRPNLRASRRIGNPGYPPVEPADKVIRNLEATVAPNRKISE